MSVGPPVQIVLLSFETIFSTIGSKFLSNFQEVRMIIKKMDFSNSVAHLVSYVLWYHWCFATTNIIIDTPHSSGSSASCHIQNSGNKTLEFKFRWTGTNFNRKESSKYCCLRGTWVVSVFPLASTNVHTELKPIGIERQPLSLSNENSLLLSLSKFQIFNSIDSS